MSPWTKAVLSAVLGAWTSAAAQETRVEFHDTAPECAYRQVGCKGAGDPSKRRSDDLTEFDKGREFLFPETGVDPMRRKYEELFGEAYPPPKSEALAPSSPFAEVKKFNEAFDRAAAAGTRAEVQSKGGVLSVSVVVPDSEAKSLTIYVNDERILLSLASPTPPSSYRIVRRQDLAIPNPPGIDPSTAVVDRRGDRIKISFLQPDPERKSPAAAPPAP